MKYAILLSIAVLSACNSPDPGRIAALEAEADYHANMQYRQDVADHRAFRPEVYAEPEFLADCEYYQMIECYE